MIEIWRDGELLKKAEVKTLVLKRSFLGVFILEGETLERLQPQDILVAKKGTTTMTFEVTGQEENKFSAQHISYRFNRFAVIDKYFQTPPTYDDTFDFFDVDVSTLLSGFITPLVTQAGFTLTDNTTIADTKDISFSGDNLLSAFQKICDTFGVEFTVNDTVVTFADQIGSVKNITITAGVQTKAINVSKGFENLCTRLFPIGSSDNLPENYFYTALRPTTFDMATGEHTGNVYLEYGIATFGEIEKILAFSEVKVKSLRGLVENFFVDSVRVAGAWYKDEAITKSTSPQHLAHDNWYESVDVYTGLAKTGTKLIKDTDYTIGGYDETEGVYSTITFAEAGGTVYVSYSTKYEMEDRPCVVSSSLAGLDVEKVKNCTLALMDGVKVATGLKLLGYNADTQRVWYDKTLENGKELSFDPTLLSKFILEGYITQAQMDEASTELAEQAQAYLEENQTPLIQYSLDIVYLGNTSTIPFECGDTLTLKDGQQEIDASVRVQEYEYDLLKGVYNSVTLSDRLVNAPSSVRQTVEVAQKVYDLTNKTGNLSDVAAYVAQQLAELEEKRAELLVDLTELDQELYHLANYDLLDLQDELNTLNTELDTLINSALPALEDDLSDLGGELSTLTNTTIPELHSAISTLEADMDTLQTTTLPGLQSAITTLDADMGTLQTTTIPGLQAELDDKLDDLPNEITETHITNGSISTAKIKANAVTANEIAAGAVTTAKLYAGAVTAEKIAALAIQAAHIAAGAIVAGKIATNAVTASTIKAGAITTEKIGALQVTAGNIAASAVTTDKLYALAVTAEKIAVGAITAAKIAVGAITAEKIAAGAVIAEKIGAGAITAEKIMASAVTADKVAAGAITASKIGAGAITAEKIGAGAVTTEKLYAGSVTADKVAADSIAGNHLAATLTVQAGKKINVGSNNEVQIMAKSDNTGEIYVQEHTGLTMKENRGWMVGKRGFGQIVGDINSEHVLTNFLSVVAAETLVFTESPALAGQQIYFPTPLLKSRLKPFISISDIKVASDLMVKTFWNFDTGDADYAENIDCYLASYQPGSWSNMTLIENSTLHAKWQTAANAYQVQVVVYARFLGEYKTITFSHVYKTGAGASGKTVTYDGWLEGRGWGNYAFMNRLTWGDGTLNGNEWIKWSLSAPTDYSATILNAKNTVLSLTTAQGEITVIVFYQ